MATGDVVQFDYFQLPHTGVPRTGETLGRPTQSRDLDMKISKWNAPYVDNRMDDDYTRTVLDFANKDDSADWKVITEDGGAGGRGGLRSITVITNPYVWGDSIKRIWDDQFHRLSMSNYNDSIELPSFDVMDTNVVKASGLESGKNWPTEGWRSYGGKYDFAEAYGGGVPPR